ncbi:signal peptidase I [Enterococcus sp. AZ192]|uniref:signal peptidase I n=1 Tax=unclassified Enterococcus TaxID=2608891 RepID=UPI003D2BFC34
MTATKKVVKTPKKRNSSSQSKKNKQYIKRDTEETKIRNTKKRTKQKNSSKVISEPSKRKKNKKVKQTLTSTKIAKNRKRPTPKVRRKKCKRNKLRALLIQLLLTVVISISVFSTIIYFTIRTPRMEGYAMTTALTDNDRILVSKMGEVKRFKMIYFKHPRTKEKTVRRVIALPGDELFYKNDELFINNKLTPERFLEKSIADAKQSGFLLTQDFTLRQTTNETRVPENKYFVMGDNRQFSTDSRDYGFVDQKDIIGVVEMRIFPLDAAAQF